MPADAISLKDQNLEDREFLVWLRNVEKKAILPLKWAIFVTAVVFWMLNHRSMWLPPVEVFTLFTLYFMANLGESYFLYLSRVSLSQVRHLCITSYCVDILFITVLVYYDVKRFPTVDGPASDFYIFYFLLILRGFALFRTPRANLMSNAVIGSIFIISLLWQEEALIGVSSRSSMIRVVFIWLVITMTWFIAQIISRQKDEIMRARENLVRTESMASLGQIAAGVAHEINNPIGIISAYAEYLERNAAPDDARLEDFQIIHKEARRCENIVAELLNYARPHNQPRGPVDVRVMCDEVLDFLFRRHSGQQVIVEREYDEHLPLLPADGNQLKQALLNLCMNARQAMEERGGRLRVTIKSDMAQNRIVIRVEDSGKGIATDELKKVFEPFYTTKSGGTGLGLAITRRIVENQGGEISVDSELGHGTTVKLSLPFDKTVME